ncbi:GAF domain-containing sensor histidine kinase [Clostridium sp.]|uniref:GAF domain-containing sensor histidine kinase n=1 Tax=Clostridium sp. TaxID=1506 RepID=UPI003D6D90EF
MKKISWINDLFFICIGIISSIIYIRIKIKRVTIKKSKEFDKKIKTTIDIFKSTTDIKGIFKSLIDNLYEILDYDAAISVLKTDNEFKLMACRGYAEKIDLNSYLQESKCIELIEKIIECGKPSYIKDLNKSEYTNYNTCFQLVLYHMRSILIVPIIYKKNIYGIVIILKCKRSAYNETERTNAFSFVREVAVAIENAMLFQKLKDMDTMKTDFLSTVSHELRTPLTSIIGFAEMVKRKFEGSIVKELDLKIEKNQNAVVKIRRNVNIILSEGERLSSLINDLLDISRLEAGKFKLNMMEMDMEELITEVITLTNPIIRNKSLQVILSIREPLPKIMADRDKIMQVIINLVSNAIKFTQQGCIVCTARVVKENIIVCISDTGVGIREEDKKFIFEKFSQVGDTLTNKPRGTGLGLAICKHIIEEHGGEIWVESETQKGTDFSFSIPILRVKI